MTMPLSDPIFLAQLLGLAIFAALIGIVLSQIPFNTWIDALNQRYIDQLKRAAEFDAKGHPKWLRVKRPR